MKSIKNKIEQVQYEVKHITVEPLFQPIRDAVIETLKASDSTKPMCLRLTGNTDTGKSNFAKIEIPNLLNYHEKLKIDQNYGIVVVEITSTISLKTLYRQILDKINFPYNLSDNASELEKKFPLAVKRNNVGAIAIDEYNQVKHGNKDAIRRLQNMLINIPLKTGRALIIIGRPTMNSLFTEVEITSHNKLDTETRRIDLNNRYKKMVMPRLNLSSQIVIYYSNDESIYVYTSQSEIVLSIIIELENHLHENTDVRSFIKEDEDYETIKTMILESNGRLGSFIKIWQYSVNEAIKNKSMILDSEAIRRGISLMHVSDNLDDEVDKYDVIIEEDWDNDLLIFMSGKIRSNHFFELLIRYANDNNLKVDFDAIFLDLYLQVLNDLYLSKNLKEEDKFTLWCQYSILFWKKLVQYCLNNNFQNLSPREIKLYQREISNKSKTKAVKQKKKKRSLAKIDYRDKYYKDKRNSSELIFSWLSIMDDFSEDIPDNEVEQFIQMIFNDPELLISIESNRG